MKVKQVLNKYKNITIKVKGITLLSKEEYRECKDNIPAINKPWWLRSPGHYVFFAACVYGDGSIDYYGYDVDNSEFGVRPVLIIKSNLQIKDEFNLAGHAWTVISEDYAICNDIIGEYCFREDWRAKDSNNYKKSDIKKYIEDWAKENGIIGEQK